MYAEGKCYITLFQKMTARIPGLKVCLQAYCTDGEKVLREALGQEFERSVAFVCKIHEKQNIKDKCSKLQISTAVSKVIDHDIVTSEGFCMHQQKRTTGKKTRGIQAEVGQAGARRHKARTAVLPRHKSESLRSYMRSMRMLVKSLQCLLSSQST